ncbi:dipeptide/oligopeptide/nickel ABC transporter permease/ATP-binding protein [Tropicimonas isoalkanivorans]|uniref:Peptide/nickel transport system permease protein n=1 Tax=Tropicimonas isoalkanivorans TaxID=441112 RepID=A0A1I1L1F8_9RHOB|nr:dipeptide/oligopeptide/nickel ABC transporter permease/ATP-binding protein [Tropicimonas isoalkanivorans]SFC66874.1 peptide/nickel transport system permease protein [Tropicimonas isoalkanivorans]
MTAGDVAPTPQRRRPAAGAFLKLFLRNRLAAAGAILLTAVVLLSVLAPLLPLQDPYAQDTAQKFLRPFSPGHLLGTDHLGRDILSRLIWGTRLSLVVGLVASFGAAFFGSVIGITAGYFGGRTDNWLMRAIDMLMAFPYILLALAIVAALGPGLVNALIAVAVVNIPFFARNIRGVTVTLAHKEFVDAARLAGMTDLRIMVSEILPNVLPVIVIAMSTTVGWMILETAGLSFLGLGSQPPVADLGSMLGEGRNALITDPHASIVPGLMIFVIVMSVNLLGDGIRDALDPRLRSGALTRPMARTIVDRNAVPQPPADPALLNVQELRTEFRVGSRTLKALSGVTLQVRPGECLGLIGESGSGKSVTALSVMGLVASPPGVIAGGAVRYAGTEVLGAPFSELRKLRGDRISYIFQDPLATLHPLYRVGDQIVEAIQAHHAVSKSKARARALELLEAVRIPNASSRIDNFPHELSGGMRQRVGIAMALVNEPDLIIADEPTTALDVTVQAQILSLLDDLRRERGVAILFITHDFGVVAQLCDRIAVMYAGRIVETGPTAAILADPAHPYTRRLIACVPELGEGQRELHAIPGLPPAVDDLPPGCAFAPRCDKAQPACRTGEIPLDAFGSERAVRCLFPESDQAGGAA